MGRCSALLLARSSRASVGRATLRMVTSRVITMRLAHTVTSGTDRPDFGSARGNPVELHQSMG
jgi:hypothetical protein